MTALNMLFINCCLFLQTEPLSPRAQADYFTDHLQTMSLIVNGLLALMTIIFMALTYRVGRKRSEADHKLAQVKNSLEKAKEYIKSHTVIDYLYQDIVLLGPRNSGKTSVAKLWTEPAFNIEELSYTTQWQSYERDILEFDEYIKKNDTFAIDIKYHRRLRIRIHDYPGEDKFRLQAIRELPNLKNPVLLLFFDVQADSTGIQTIHRNNSYYSQAFMETVRSQEDITLGIPKVVVVFNKADLLPATMGFDVAKERLKQINADAVERIESLFSGKLSYLTISALDNRGLIRLLGVSGSPTLPAEVKKLFDDKIKTLAVKAKEEHG